MTKNSSASSITKYFHEIKSCARLSKEAEREVADNKERCFIELQDKVLSYPKSWELIFSMWKYVKDNNKSCSKLTEDHGNFRFKAAELASELEKNLFKANEEFLFGDDSKVPDLIKSARLSKSIYLDIANKLVSDYPEIKNYLDSFYYYRDELVKANFKLVINYAKSFSIHGVPFEDLLQEGNVGLIRASEKFDPSKGHKFSTYATWWIRQSFIHLVKTQSKTIRLPSHIHNSLTKLKKINEEFEFKNNRDATLQELAELSGISERDIEQLYESRVDPLPLDMFVNESNSNNGQKVQQVKEFIEDSVDYEEKIFDNINKEKLLSIMDAVLEPEEKTVLLLRFGIHEPELTFCAISERLDLSKQTIKYLYTRGLLKLKNKVKELL